MHKIPHDQSLNLYHYNLQEFYQMLDNPAAAVAAASEKENVEAHHGGELGELADPFGGSSNPYQQNMARARGVSDNRGPGSYQKRHTYAQNQNNASNISPYQRNGSFNQYQKQQSGSKYTHVPNRAQAPPTNVNHVRSPTPNNVSPTLTEEQRRRMEENRQRALAIRLKKQQGSS
jgi:hypothetical protein